MKKGIDLWKKIAYGEGAKKKVKKTNNSAFSATHTYIKLTLVSFFYFFLCCWGVDFLCFLCWVGGGHSGLNQGVRLSYYNFQISPRTPCTISTDCFAETPVTVSSVHLLYYVPLCVWYLMFELSVFLFLWHCCTRTISARAAQYWGWAPNREHSCVVVFIIFIFMSFDIGRRRVLLTMKYILIMKQNAAARWHCNAEYLM